MLKAIGSFALLTAFAAAPVMLHADTFTFTISTASGPGTDPATTFVATGTLTGPADPFTSGAFDIQSITGSANGYNFLGVVDPGTTNSHTTATVDGFTFDNVLYTTGSAFTDANGFLLDLDSPIGTSLAHVFFTGITATNPDGYEVDVIDPNDPGAVTPFAIDSFTISPNTVPEPSTLAMLSTGILGLAGMVRRRFTR